MAKYSSEEVLPVITELLKIILLVSIRMELEIPDSTSDDDLINQSLPSQSKMMAKS